MIYILLIVAIIIAAFIVSIILWAFGHAIRIFVLSKWYRESMESAIELNARMVEKYKNKKTRES